MFLYPSARLIVSLLVWQTHTTERASGAAGAAEPDHAGRRAAIAALAAHQADERELDEGQVAMFADERIDREHRLPLALRAGRQAYPAWRRFSKAAELRLPVWVFASHGANIIGTWP